MGDEITIIRDGKVIGTVNAARTNERELARMMVGRDVLLRVEKESHSYGDVRLFARGPDRPLRHGRGRRERREPLRCEGVRSSGSLAWTATAKTELAEALACTRHVEGGRVYLDGQDVTRLGADALEERGLAYVPEDRATNGLVQDFALYENNTLKTYSGERPFSRFGVIFPKVMRRRAAESFRWLLHAAPPS